MDLYELADEYRSAKDEVKKLRDQILRMNKVNITAVEDFVLPKELAVAEKTIENIVAGWKRKMLRLELFICRYDLVANTLNQRERVVLKLHFEDKISLRKIQSMNLEQYGIESISISTLSRTSRSVVNQFSLQMQIRKRETPVSEQWLSENE